MIEKNNNLDNIKIDLVYLWVDQNDKNYIKKNKKFLIDIQTNSCRLRQHDELKYSLRSVEKNIPWINNIFIVTDCQIPKWLNIKNNKIHIIDHAMILPKDALPTFNSDAIETAIYKIPNLSQHFIYANDDFFILKKLDKTYFFDKDAKPINFFSPWKPHKKAMKSFWLIQMLKNNSAWKDKKKFIQPTHTFTAYLKSDYANVVNNSQYSRFYEATTYCKFRSIFATQRSLINIVLYNSKKMVLKKNRVVNSITISPKWTWVLSFFHPNQVCINDSNHATENDFLIMKKYILLFFRDKSEFEK